MTTRDRERDLLDLVQEGVTAFGLTREYLAGDEGQPLPAITGWTWWDWVRKAVDALDAAGVVDGPALLSQFQQPIGETDTQRRVRIAEKDHDAETPVADVKQRRPGSLDINPTAYAVRCRAKSNDGFTEYEHQVNVTAGLGYWRVSTHLPQLRADYLDPVPTTSTSRGPSHVDITDGDVTDRLDRAIGLASELAVLCAESVAAMEDLKTIAGNMTGTVDG